MDDLEFYRTMAHRLLEENRQLEDLVDYHERQRANSTPAAYSGIDWRAQANQARKMVAKLESELEEIRKEREDGSVLSDANEITIDLDDGSRLVIIRETD